MQPNFRWFCHENTKWDELLKEVYHQLSVYDEIYVDLRL
jgi:hypothetical protein